MMTTQSKLIMAILTVTILIIVVGIGLVKPQAKGKFQYYNAWQRENKILGCDISKWQYVDGDVDFEKMYDAGARFVIMKAGGVTSTYARREDNPETLPYTGLSKDEYFLKSHVAKARDAGLRVGFYWIKNPNIVDDADGSPRMTITHAQEEATIFYNYITQELGTDDVGDIYPMLDFENGQGQGQVTTVSNDEALQWIEAFINRFHELSGVRCGFYTYYWTVDGFTEGENDELIHSAQASLADLASVLWLSANAQNYYHYNFNQFGGYTAWDIWQFSTDGNGRGAEFGATSDDIDLNVLEGDLSSILIE